jgi:hypothetical protein
MCGLVGLLTKNQYGFHQKQNDIFNCLLFVDFLRGEDSTGVFTVTRDGEVSLAKDVGGPIEFMKTEEFRKVSRRAFGEGIAMIGHNRKATQGSITDVNAHPHVVDNKVVLVHNGTLWGDWKKIADVQVDSQAIAHAIHEAGDDVEKAIHRIDGAYALIWYEVENKKLCFLRNSQRPLHWVETKDEYIWASEANMLDWVISRFNLVVVERGELPENHINVFEWKHGWDISSKKLAPKPFNYQQQTGYVRAPVQQQHRRDACAYDHGFGMGDDTCSLDDDLAWNRAQRRQQLQTDYNNLGWFGNNANNQKVYHRESEIALTNKKLMSYSEYYKIKDVVGKRFTASAFDYIAANNVDDSGGWYLYLYHEDHENLILRKWFAQTDMSEERLIQIATGGYTAEVDMSSNIEWYPVPSGAPTKDVQMGKALARVASLTWVSNKAEA